MRRASKRSKAGVDSVSEEDVLAVLDPAGILPTPTAYRTSPIKRKRRSASDMQAIRSAMFDLLSADNPMTVRQVFYQLFTKGAIKKSEAEYKQTVCRLLGEMRRERQIPFGWIADSTRWMRKPKTFSSLDAALRATAENYRRAVWADLDVYVEIWLEKEALAGVLIEETAVWDVPLMVTRGYPSLTYLYEAAEAIASYEKPTFIYYFGDCDPSGLDITRTVEAGLREFAPEADITFERVAVTREQIADLRLPTAPPKKTDSRSKGFTGPTVQVDAIPPAMLRQIARECIEQHVPEGHVENLEMVEAEERKVLTMFAKRRKARTA